uniref:Xaa-Pro dipeptidase n=1 Tax=Tabanus bromius TaxID=304241 RepID=A0A0K8TSP9_TABBR
MAKFYRGDNTLEVPMSMFRDNRERVAAELRKVDSLDDSAYVLLQGGTDINLHDTDVVLLFRQESYFQYCFGVKEPDCYGAIHVKTGKATLFVPRLPEEYAVWMGRLLTLDDFQKMYEVFEVKYTDEIDQFFSEKNPSVLLTLHGVNSDSGLSPKPVKFEGIEKYKVDKEILYPIITECRVFKSPEEIEVLRYVAKVSSDAHKKVMRKVRPGMLEYQAESIFLHHCYYQGGCRHVSYTCICGSHTNGAILHYGHAGAPNESVIRDGSMCLFDMGGNYCGYAADITCSFPANGKFTEDQKFIYNAVLAGRNAVLAAAKDGVSWVDMHKLSNRVLLEKLKEGGMLKGDVDDMLNAGLGAIFQPHGLGHLIGLDVHDVGGYLPGQPSRPTEPGVNRLRFARTLKAGMYVTVEPGCYFIEILMDKALSDPNMVKHINVDVYERFRNFGGVRIEDDVLITKDGNENFAIVPRTVEEIEEWMASSAELCDD